MVKYAKVRLGIDISPEVAQKLKIAIVDHLLTAKLGSDEKQESPKGDLPDTENILADQYVPMPKGYKMVISSIFDTTKMPVFKIGTITTELDRILKDGKIYKFEAIAFYHALLAVVGDDMVVDESDIPLIIDSYANTAKELLKQTEKNIKLKDMKKTVGLAQVPMTTLSKAYEAITIPIKDELIKKAFSDLIKILKEQLKYTNGIVAALREEEWSFMNFISAENLLGLSTYFTADQMPLSSSELIAMEKYKQYLLDVYVGAITLINNYQQGTIPENNELVQEFLQSPFLMVGSVDAIFTSNELNDASITDDKTRVAAYSAGVIKTFLEFGATETAENYYDELFAHEGVENSELEEMLPSAAMSFASGPVTTFANVFLSLDSLFLISTGQFIGSLLGSSAKTALWLKRASKTVGPFGKLLPGSELFTFSTKGAMKTIGKGALNFAGEAAKVTAYGYGASLIAGNVGFETSTGLYLLTAGMNFGFKSGLGRSIFNELVNDKSSKIVDTMIVSGLYQKADFSSTIAPQLRYPKLGSFKFAKKIPSAQVNVNFEEKFAKYENIYGLKKAKLKTLVDEINQYAKENSDILGNTKPLKLKQIDTKGDLLAAEDELNKYFAKLKKKVNKAKALPYSPTKATYTSIPQTKGKSKGAGGSAKSNGNNLSTTAETVKQKTQSEPSNALLDYINDTKPKDMKLNAKTVETLTGGKVAIKNDVLETLTTIAASDKSKAKAFYKSLAKLLDKKWEMRQFPGEVISKPYYAKLGRDYRLFATQESDGTFLIFKCENRGNISQYSNK